MSPISIINIAAGSLKLLENQTKAITKTVTSRVTSPRSSRSGSLKVLRSSLIDPTSINGAGSTSPKTKPSRPTTIPNSSNTTDNNVQGITNAEIGAAVLRAEIGTKESINGNNFNQKSWLESQGGAVVNDSKPPKYGQTPRKRTTNETRKSSFDMVGSTDVGKSIQNPNHRSWSDENGSKTIHTEKTQIPTPSRGIAPPRSAQTPPRGSAQTVVGSPSSRSQIPINPASPRRRPEKPAKPEKFQRMAKESPGGSVSSGMLPPKGAPPRQRPPPRRQSSLQYDTSSIKAQEMSPPVPIPKPLEPIESRLGFQSSNMFADHIVGHGDTLEYQSKGIKIHNEPNEAQLRSSMKTPDTFQNQPQMTHPRFNSKTMPHSIASPSGQSVSSRPVPKPRKSIQRRNSYHR